MTAHDFHTYARFAINELIPAAVAVVKQKYEDHCQGIDIAMHEKGDKTLASSADLEAEQIQRRMIHENYPEHGVWGEEEGLENPEAETLWVLDPVDGTREFADQKPGKFGILTGLLHNRVPVFGVIADPISGKIYTSDDDYSPPSGPEQIENAIVSCTNPEVMFDAVPEYQAAGTRLRGKAKKFVTEMNCMGFVKAAQGDFHLVMETDLKLHDIAAVVPVLLKAGLTVVDFDGESYEGRSFDLSNENQTYEIIVASNPALAGQALNLLKGQNNHDRELSREPRTP